MKRTSEVAMNSSVPPKTTLGLHIYGLECLLENRSYFASRQEQEVSGGYEDKAVNSLANSLHRTVVSFGKISTANAESEAVIAEHLSKKVLPLLEKIKHAVVPLERILGCQTFLETKDLLTQLFDRGNIDTHTLQLGPSQPLHPQSSTLQDPAPSALEAPLATNRSPADLERQGITACTNLATQVTSLEKWIASECTSPEFDADAIRASLEQTSEILRALPPGGDDTETAKTSKIRHSLNRSLERLHHYAYRAYRLSYKSTSTPSHSAHATSTLREILSAFCDAADTQESSPEVHARMIDTLLLFAHADFAVDAPTTYRNSFAHIERCQCLIEHRTNPAAVQRLQGTIASTAYALGRSLYNAEKYANAIPFLTASCTITDNLLAAAGTTGDLEDAKTSLLDKSASRWELLGSAYTQCKEKEDAVHAYIKCLQSLHHQSAGADPAQVPHDLAFMRVLTKYTKASILDMSRQPDEASIAASLELSCASQLGALTMGFMLEAQFSCLVDHMHKPEAFRAGHQWLTDAAHAFKTGGSDANLAR